MDPTGLHDRGGRDDRRRLERLCLPGVLRGGGDLDDRRGEARRPGDAGRLVCGAGRVRGFLSLSPPTREAHRGHRARHRMVGAPGGAENVMTDWGWLGLPLLASAHGGQIDSMLGWVHVFMLILFIGWGGFFIYCLIRFRRSRNPVANYTGVKSHASNYSEIGVAVVEAVLLFGFAIPLWAARIGDIPPENESLIVQVTGEQFAWNMHYPGPDGAFGRTDITLLDLQSNPLGLDRSDPAAMDDVTTVNQLYLPV